MIKGEKGITINFVRDKVVGKKLLVTYYNCLMIMENISTLIINFD